MCPAACVRILWHSIDLHSLAWQRIVVIVVMVGRSFEMRRALPLMEWELVAQREVLRVRVGVRYR